MKGCIMFKITVASIAVLLLAGVATAGIEPGDDLISFNIGYATGKAAVSGSTVEGPVFAFNYENLAWDKPVAFFFSAGWSEVTKEESGTGPVSGTDSLTRQIETWPIYLGAKWYLGQGTFQGHLGASLGLYFSTVETAVTHTGEEYAKWSAAGWGMGVPLGITVSMGDTAFINAEYFLNWMWNNDAFDNDLLHTVLLGVGFNLGK